MTDGEDNRTTGGGAEGLAFLRAVFAKGGFGKGIGRTLGFAGATADEGFVTVVGTPTTDHYNPQGTVHGGYAATLLDAAMALAVQTLVSPGTPYATTDLKVTYVRSLRAEDGTVRAEGRVVHLGRSLAVAEGRLLDADGSLFAHGTCTFRMGRPGDAKAIGGADARPDPSRPT